MSGTMCQFLLFQPFSEPPSHRNNFSMSIHPDNPEIIFLCGKFYNGQTTKMFHNLIIYNIKVRMMTYLKKSYTSPSLNSQIKHSP